MSSQAAEAEALLQQDRRRRAVLEGESAGPAYGSADEQGPRDPAPPTTVPERSHLPNGVAPRGGQADRTRSPMRADRSAGRPLEPPQRGQEGDSGRGREVIGLGIPSPESSVFASVDSATSMRSNPPRVGDEPHQAARTLQMEYAAYDNGEGQPMVRWVARLTEFLRATTARSAGFQGRFLEGLGLTGSQGTGQAVLHQHAGARSLSFHRHSTTNSPCSKPQQRVRLCHCHLDRLWFFHPRRNYHRRHRLCGNLLRRLRLREGCFRQSRLDACSSNQERLPTSMGRQQFPRRRPLRKSRLKSKGNFGNMYKGMRVRRMHSGINSKTLGENVIFSWQGSSVEYHMVIGLQRSSMEYHMAIGLQSSSMEYRGLIGLQCSSVEYHLVIGLQRSSSVQYHMAIGLQTSSMEYRGVIGLQCNSVEYHLVIGLHRSSMEYHMAIGLQSSSMEYRGVIGLQCSSVEYHLVIGLPRSSVEYHVAIGLQRSMEYRMVIVLQSSMEYHVAIGLQRSMEYRMVIVVQSSMEYRMVIVSQSSMEYHVAIGLQRSMEYRMVIVVQSSMEYRMVIVSQSSMEYLVAIGLQSSMEYLVAIGLQSSMEYLVAIGLQSSMEYLVAIGLQSSMEYLAAIGLQSSMEYLTVIKPCSQESLMVVRFFSEQAPGS